MLVRMADTAATGPVRTLADWMSRWTGPGAAQGVVLFNVDLAGPNTTQPLEAVVWTPVCCVVIEVEQLAEFLNGELQIPLNGPWTVEGRPVRFAGFDERTPLDQSRDSTFALQNWFAGNGLGQRSVRGVVLLLPPGESDLRLSLRWTDPSFAVLLGDTDSRLRDYFTFMPSDARETWTANDVANAFHALDLVDQLPGPDELLAEGFLGPVDPLLWPNHDTRHHSRPDPAPDMGADQPAAAGPYPAAGGPPARLPYNPWVLYPKVPGETHAGRAAMRIVLAAGMLVGFVWLVWFFVSALVYLGS
jgi:hypothetical protein